MVGAGPDRRDGTVLSVVGDRGAAVIAQRYETGSELARLGDMTQQQNWYRTAGEAWAEIHPVPSVSYTCGYCGRDVASGQGWHYEYSYKGIRVCPQCNAPTFVSAQGEQHPGALRGGEVTSLTDDVRRMYDEARRALTVGAATGTVMLCRKILMHVAVDKGASKDLSFLNYVEWLAEENWIPKGGQSWVDLIRSRGNEANHELPHMTEADATGILQFTETLLRVIYELPAAVPTAPDS